MTVEEKKLFETEPEEEEEEDDVVEEEEEDDDDDEEEEEEEDLVDPLDEARTACRETKECQKYVAKLETCENRVSSKSNTEETCVEEMMDLLHSIDHCATKSLFNKVK